MREPGSEAVDMNVAVMIETAKGEKRVAAVPATVEKMVKAGMQVSIQSGAGLGSTINDDEYAAAGARIDPRPEAVLEGAGSRLRVQPPSAAELDPDARRAAVIPYTLQAHSD